MPRSIVPCLLLVVLTAGSLDASIVARPAPATRSTLLAEPETPDLQQRLQQDIAQQGIAQVYGMLAVQLENVRTFLASAALSPEELPPLEEEYRQLDTAIRSGIELAPAVSDMLHARLALGIAPLVSARVSALTIRIRLVWFRRHTAPLLAERTSHDGEALDALYCNLLDSDAALRAAERTLAPEVSTAQFSERIPEIQELIDAYLDTVVAVQEARIQRLEHTP